MTGAVGSVTGNVGGNVVGSVGSVTGNVGGNVTGSVGSVVGNVGGNVTGSVGSVTAAVTLSAKIVLQCVIQPRKLVLLDQSHWMHLHLQQPTLCWRSG